MAKKFFNQIFSVSWLGTYWNQSGSNKASLFLSFHLLTLTLHVSVDPLLMFGGILVSVLGRELK